MYGAQPPDEGVLGGGGLDAQGFATALEVVVEEAEAPVVAGEDDEGGLSASDVDVVALDCGVDVAVGDGDGVVTGGKGVGHEKGGGRDGLGDR